MHHLHHLLVVTVSVASTASIACGAEASDFDIDSREQAAGVTGPAFYVAGELYRTVGTPTEFTEAQPEHSFDTLYELGGLQPNVAANGPGLLGFNGGRWEVHLIEFGDYDGAVALHDANGSGDFDSASEIESALEAGDAFDAGIVRRFECPVIKVPASQ